MIGEVSLVILCGVILYQGYTNHREREQFRQREDALLNRIMSRNYETYVNAEVVKKEAETVREPKPEFEWGIPVS